MEFRLLREGSGTCSQAGQLLAHGQGAPPEEAPDLGSAAYQQQLLTEMQLLGPKVGGLSLSPSFLAVPKARPQIESLPYHVHTRFKKLFAVVLAFYTTAAVSIHSQSLVLF